MQKSFTLDTGGFIYFINHREKNEHTIKIVSLLNFFCQRLEEWYINVCAITVRLHWGQEMKPHLADGAPPTGLEWHTMTSKQPFQFGEDADVSAPPDFFFYIPKYFCFIFH